jgi:PPOX class probable F420-dependent enzyme
VLAFVQHQRVGRLATVDASGAPTVVPICFAVLAAGSRPIIVSVLDEKPKRVPARELARVRNILAQPRVAIVVDRYSEDWSSLAFVQLHGTAELIEPDHPLHAPAVAQLRAKYHQYERMAIEHAPIILIDQLEATSWRAIEANGPAVPEARPGEVELASLIRGRRSVRSFHPTAVPRATIEQAIAAAGWAPSPHGRQPWRFVVIESAERRTALADAMAASWQEQLELDGQSAEIVKIRLEKSRQRLRTAPVLIVPCLYLADLDEYPDPARQEAERIMAIQSLGAAVQNLLLSIYAAGLDAGWMCAPLFCPGLVRTELRLDEFLTPHALIPVGYAANDPVRRGRLPLDALIVQWE